MILVRMWHLISKYVWFFFSTRSHFWTNLCYWKLVWRVTKFDQKYNKNLPFSKIYVNWTENLFCIICRWKIIQNWITVLVIFHLMQSNNIFLHNEGIWHLTFKKTSCNKYVNYFITNYPLRWKRLKEKIKSLVTFECFGLSFN